LIYLPIVIELHIEGSQSKTPPAKNGEKKKDSSKHDDDHKTDTAKTVVFGDRVDTNTGRNRSSSPKEHKKEQKKETGATNKKTGH